MDSNLNITGIRGAWKCVCLPLFALASALSLAAIPLSARQEPPPPQAAAPPGQSLPSTLTLPAGTVIPVRAMEWLSSDQNHPGDSFSAVLDQPLVVNGWVVARRGQYLFGRVVVAQKAARGKHASQLGVDLNELTIVDGRSLPVQTQLLQSTGPRATGRDIAMLAATTILGAAIGGAAGDESGAVIGAAAGATAGGIAVLETRGRPTVISPETLLTFRLVAPLAISTEEGSVAFHPVSQQDYNPAPGNLERRPIRGYPEYGPWSLYYPYGYYGYWPYGWGWAYYPAPYSFGFYGLYGDGPRIRRFGRFDRDDSGRRFRR